MDDYDLVVSSSVKFKGEKRKKKKKALKSSKKSARDEVKSEDAIDIENHGGWWTVNKVDQIKGELAIEFIPGIYAKALSDGSIVLGDLHPHREGPDDEEIFASIVSNGNMLALKSGFGKYLSVDSANKIVGLSEAVGERELFLPVFENDETALSTYNDFFVSPDEESENFDIVARSKTVGDCEKLKLRVRCMKSE